MRVYLDSAPLIYLVENVSPYAATLITHLATPGTIQVCSELSRLECRVKPLRDGQTDLLTAFDTYFTHIITHVIPLSHQVIDQATELRARYGFKTPDAIHLAAAIIDGCNLFLTNDHRLDKCTDIAIETLTP